MWVGKQASEQNIAKAVATHPERGTTRKSMSSYLRKSRVPHRTVAATLDDLTKAIQSGSPAIVNFIEPFEDVGHYSVAVDVEDESITLHDPDHSAYFRMSKEEFAKRWLGYKTRKVDRGWMIAIKTDKLPASTYRSLHPACDLGSNTDRQ